MTLQFVQNSKNVSWHKYWHFTLVKSALVVIPGVIIEINHWKIYVIKSLFLVKSAFKICHCFSNLVLRCLLLFFLFLKNIQRSTNHGIGLNLEGLWQQQCGWLVCREIFFFFSLSRVNLDSLGTLATLDNLVKMVSLWVLKA